MGFLDRIKQAVGDISSSFQKTPTEQKEKKPRRVSFTKRLGNIAKPKGTPAEIRKRQEMIKSLQQSPKDIINKRVGSEVIRSFTGFAPPANSKAGEVATSIATEIARSFPRVAVSVGLTAQGEIERKRTGLAPKTTQVTASTGFEKFILGNDPVKSIPARIEEARTVIKKTLLDMGNSEGASNFTAMKLAPVAIVGSTALDLIPGSSPAKSGLKGAGSALLRVSDDAGDILRAINAGEDLRNFKGVNVVKVKQFLTKHGINDPEDLRRIEELVRPLNANIQNTDDFVKQVVAKDVLSRKPPEAEGFFKKPINKTKETWKEIQTALIDKTTPIKQVLSKFEKSSGSVIRPQKDFRYLYNKSLFSEDRSGEFMRRNGLTSVIQKVDDIDEFASYIMRKQALRVEEFGINSGLDIVESRKFVQSLDAKYREQAKLVTQYSRKILDEMVEAGLTTRETAEHLTKKFPDYVPLNRIMDEVEETGSFSSKAIGSLSEQSLIQTLKGSDRAIENPLISLVLKTKTLFQEADRNRIASAMAEYRRLPDNPFGIEVLRTSEQVLLRREMFQKMKVLNNKLKPAIKDLKINTKANKKLSSEIDTLMGEVDELMEEAATLGARQFEDNKGLISQIKRLIARVELRDTKIGNKLTQQRTAEEIQSTLTDFVSETKTLKKDLFLFTRKLKDKKLKDLETPEGKGTFHAIKNGIREDYAIDKEFETVLKSLGSQELNLLLRVMRVPVRIFKAGVTGLFPPFLIQNVVRDTATAVINSKEAMQTVANPKVFMAALMDTLKHGKLYDDAVRAAGITNSFDILRDAPDVTVASIRSQRSKTARAVYIATRPKELLRTIENYVARSEEFRRLSEFEGIRRSLKAQGVSDEVADLIAGKSAADVTANFRNQGTLSKQLGAVFPFFNAALQGSKSFVDAIKRNPKGVAFKLAATVYTPITAATVWNLSDPGRRAVYEDIEEYERENNLILILPPMLGFQGTEAQGKDERKQYSVLKIPVPPQLASLANAPRKVVESMYDVDELRFMDFAASFMGAVDPLGLDIGQGEEAFSRSLINAITPQIGKPLLESVQGKSLFTGAPIQETKSGTAQAIENLPITPKNIEHLTKGYFGSLGSSALNFSDQALVRLGVLKPNQVGGESMVQNLIRRFGKAKGGALDNEAREIADKRIEEKEAAFSAFDKEVVRLMKELQSLPPESQAAAITKLNNISPRVVERMGEILEAETKNFTGTDYAIQRGTIEDGTRAKIIVDIMTERKMNNTQIQEFLADLGEKKLLTNEVLGQVVELLTKE